MRWPRCRAAGLEVVKPGLDSRLPKAPVTAEANVRDPSGARLSPDPVGLHSETLGEFLSGQQPVHEPSSDEVGERAVVGAGARYGRSIGLVARGHGGRGASDGLYVPLDVLVVGVLQVAMFGKYCVWGAEPLRRSPAARMLRTVQRAPCIRGQATWQGFRSGSNRGSGTRFLPVNVCFCGSKKEPLGAGLGAGCQERRRCWCLAPALWSGLAGSERSVLRPATLWPPARASADPVLTTAPAVTAQAPPATL